MRRRSSWVEIFAYMINAAFAVSCVAFFVYVAKDFDRRITGILSATILLGAPILAALVVTTIQKFMPRGRVPLAICIASLVIPIYVFDAAIMIDALSAGSTMSPGKEERQESLRERALALRAKGEKAFVAPSPQFFLKWGIDSVAYEPAASNGKPFILLGGVANSLAVLCRTVDGDFLVYRSDEKGLRNPPGIFADPSPHDLILVGDSFVHGVCLEEDDLFVGGLRRRYPRLLNLGLRGTGPLLQLGALREYAIGRKARHVIWFFFEANDFADLQFEASSEILRRYLEPQFLQGLSTDQELVDRLYERTYDSVYGANHFLLFEDRQTTEAPPLAGRLATLLDLLQK